MTRSIVNIPAIDFQPRAIAFPATGSGAPPECYDAKVGKVGAIIGAQQLGYNITAVPTGKCAFPAHNHFVNEEMFFVLQGTGEVRIGANVYPLQTGDFVACPAGGPETAHQIVNTGSDELRYLAVSTSRSPEICEYPKSGKFSAIARFPASTDGKAKTLRYFGREAQSLNYWDGE